jgi:pimeloyl-ACP methyl ester carboxylesterase
MTSARNPAARFATVNGLRIHYLEWGRPDGRPLILLHGIARHARTFEHLAPHFSARCRVIAVDMRGHGESDWDPKGEYLVEDYYKDVEALTVQLGLVKDVVLWGNSTGGRVAQVYAGLHPERVAAVIVEDVGPERPPAISERRAKRMAVEEDGWASGDELLAQVRKTYPRTPEPLLRSLIAHGSKPRADGRIVWKRDPAINNGFVPTEIWRYVRKIEAPITYILGGASTIVPPETQEELKRVLPQVQIVTMPGLGHYPSEEKPEEFLSLVDPFLRAAESRKAKGGN